mmetsp:Transcript_18938/g.63890  ORF Transcript_18938/g.63890 Transcript_18938/m.63890 type:complete len:221 (-) Transcript_18938:9-671(-)
MRERPRDQRGEEGGGVVARGEPQPAVRRLLGGGAEAGAELTGEEEEAAAVGHLARSDHRQPVRQQQATQSAAAERVAGRLRHRAAEGVRAGHERLDLCAHEQRAGDARRHRGAGERRPLGEAAEVEERALEEGGQAVCNHRHRAHRQVERARALVELAARRKREAGRDALGDNPERKVDDHVGGAGRGDNDRPPAEPDRLAVVHRVERRRLEGHGRAREK